MAASGAFGLSLPQLEELNEDGEVRRNGEKLQALGGVHGLCEKLNVQLHGGISGSTEDVQLRQQVFGLNKLPEAVSKSWLELFIGAFADDTVQILMAAALVSLVVGFYDDPSSGWIEGVAILTAVLVVAVVTATNDFNKESQFRKLNAVKDNGNVQVIRNGSVTSLSILDLCVGDIMQLTAGDKIPADAVMCSGSDVTCNESALTGETEDKTKSTISDTNASHDPFLSSGCTISSGTCKAIVIAVGQHSRWGKIRSKLSLEQEDTPLQQKLNDLANLIGYVGMAAAGLTFIAMIVVKVMTEPLSVAGWVEYILHAFIIAVTIVVVAVPEGLPLAVTLSLAYSTQRMMVDKNLIRVLAACETMGNATQICSDKTGTLTQNKMTVTEIWIAGKIYKQLPAASEIHPALLQVLSEGIAVNSTAELLHDEEGEATVLGSKTEGAMLNMIKEWGKNYKALRDEGFVSDRGDRMFTFTSARKKMSVLQIPSQKPPRLFCKGAAEIILDSSVSYTTSEGVEASLGQEKERLEEFIQSLGRNALRAVCIAHRVLPVKNSDSWSNETGDSICPTELEQDLVLDAVVGIKDPLRPDVKDAVATCQRAGVFVRMVTGDNIETAKAIAQECGILSEGGMAMEGPTFRALTPAKLDEILPLLQVLARSSPTDKFMLVSRLNGHGLPKTKEEWEQHHPNHNWDTERDLLLPGYYDEWSATRQGECDVVGVTGDGTNDGPALKAADVGLSMGLTGTDVAKEASDIVILDDNFKSIVKAVMWGRSVFDNIRKFLQFQVTVNIVALVLTFLSAVSSFPPPLNAVMMLWVNLIMDTMGALALGTEAPTETLLQRKPYRRSAPLVNAVMWRNILCQAIFQICLLMFLLLQGDEEFGVESRSTKHFTIVFNTFVFCQVFNEFNARSIGDDMNVFADLHRNPMFMGIIAFTVLGQYLIVTNGGNFSKTEPLTQDEWIKTIVLASLTLPLGALMRLIPVRESDSAFAPTSVLATSFSTCNGHSEGKHEVGIKNSSADTVKSIEYGLSVFVCVCVWFLAPVLVAGLFESRLVPPYMHTYIHTSVDTFAYTLRSLLGLE